MTTFKLRATAAALAGIAMFGMVGSASADSTDDLLKKLRDKGVLTEAEYDDFNSTRDSEKKKKSGEIKASFKDGIEWVSGDKQNKMSINGRIQADYRGFSEENSNNEADTWDIRRAYLTAKGTFFGNYDFEITYNGASAASDLQYAWLNARYWDQAQVRFGQFKQPFGLEELGSSRFINFTERSFVSQLVPGVDRGAMLHGVPMKGVTYALGMFNGVGVQSGQNANDTAVEADGKAYTGRVTANFAELMGNKDAVFHLGAAYSNSRENGNVTAFSMRSEGRGTNILTTNGFTAIGATNSGYDLKRTGLEGAVAYGPFKIQSEYIKAKFEPDANNLLMAGATAGEDYEIKAYNAAVTWMITGESYATTYKDGTFGGRMKPKNEFVTPGAPGFGAWEVGVRYSKFDASDFNTAAMTADVFNATGANGEFNEAKSYTFGLKWIPNGNVRYLLNYVKTDMECITGFTCTDDEEKAINLRAQLDF